LVTILDLIVLDLIDGLCEKPFRRYPGIEPINYLDSPASLPVYCDFQEWLPRLAAADPGMHETLIAATGIEAAMRPLDLAPLLQMAPVAAWFSADAAV
jgi:hypothetical protein